MFRQNLDNDFWPKFIACLVALAGIINIADAWFARSNFLVALETVFPLEVFDASRTLLAISGIFLIILARGLWQKKHRAWTLSVSAVILSLFSHIFNRSQIFEIFALAILLYFLFFFRHHFTVKSRVLNIFSNIKNISFFLLLIFFYIFIGFYLFRNQFDHRITFETFTENYQNLLTGIGTDALVPRTRRALWFENSVFTINLVFIAFVFASFFSPLIQHQDPTEEDVQKILRIISQWGNSSSSYFALQPDKKYFYTSQPESVIAYRVSNGTAIALETAFCAPEEKLNSIQRFCSYMMKCGLSTAFYLVEEQDRALFEQLEFTLLKIGEDAILQTASFSLEGSEMKKVRNSVTHIQKTGMKLQWYHFNEIPRKILDDIFELHKQWSKKQSLPSLTFSLDFFPFPDDPQGYVVTALTAEGKLQAAVSFLPYKQGNALAVDSLLRSDDAPNGLIEAVVAQSIFHFKEQGIQEMSLGLVALANTQPDPITPKLVQRGRSLLFQHFNQFYNYQSLFSFKNKFHPQWQPRYLAYASNMELIKVAIAIVGVHTKQTVWQKLLPQQKKELHK